MLEDDSDVDDDDDDEDEDGDASAAMNAPIRSEPPYALRYMRSTSASAGPLTPSHS